MATPISCDVSSLWRTLMDTMSALQASPKRLNAAMLASVCIHLCALVWLGSTEGRPPASGGRYLEVRLVAASSDRNFVSAAVRKADTEPLVPSATPATAIPKVRTTPHLARHDASASNADKSTQTQSAAGQENWNQPQGAARAIEVHPTSGVPATGRGSGFSRVEIEFEIRSGQETAITQGRYLYVADGFQYGVSVVDGVGTEPAWKVESSGVITPQGLSPQLLETAGEHGERLIALSGASARGQGASTRRRMRDGLLDRQSLIFHFTLQPPLAGGGELLLSDGRAYKKYAYSVHGREEIAVPLIGILRATRVQIRPDTGSDLIELWLVPEMGNLPVRMRFRDENGAEVVQSVTKLLYR